MAEFDLDKSVDIDGNNYCGLSIDSDETSKGISEIINDNWEEGEVVNADYLRKGNVVKVKIASRRRYYATPYVVTNIEKSEVCPNNGKGKIRDDYKIIVQPFHRKHHARKLKAKFSDVKNGSSFYGSAYLWNERTGRFRTETYSDFVCLKSVNDVLLCDIYDIQPEKFVSCVI